MSNFTLRDLQEQQRPWVQHNFPGRASYQCLLGVMEEVGELAHAHLKEEQSIRISEDHIEKAKDSIADIVIFLSDYCESRGFDFQSIVEKTWNEVRTRDWKNDPVSGKREKGEYRERA